MKILFNDVKEFLAEVEADNGLIDRKIVRVTRLIRTSPHSTQDITVVATAAVGGEKISVGDRNFETPVSIIRLDRFIGTVFCPRAPMVEDKKILDRASQIVGEIENELQKIGMTVRAGIFEE